jgi:UDPglucose--hexose-1-phosphate uridylyltransferase
MPTLYERVHNKPDGRRLYLYGWQPHHHEVTEDLEPLPTPPSPHMRWHPLRQEWVAYAAHRQGRTFKPPAQYCPLCPVKAGGFPGEVPFESFEIAVFENRFPGLYLGSQAAPDLPVLTQPSQGVCEVVVYDAAHQGSIASLAFERLALLVRVWAARYRALMADSRINFVMPFENRGEEVGVTLHHPHGQIYAFPFLPPVVEKMVAGFRQSNAILPLVAPEGALYHVAQDGGISAFVPPYQRFPFETWIAPNRQVPGPWALSEDELDALARMLGHTVRRFDLLFQKTFPYIMVLYAAPKGEEAHFHFHIQFLPFLRTAERLKYLAGCEQGAGTFLVDSLPEQTAQTLRDIKI